ncbi:hypothetical protein V8E54_011393 [Elaphomyces granulatus]
MNNATTYLHTQKPSATMQGKLPRRKPLKQPGTRDGPEGDEISKLQTDVSAASTVSERDALHDALDKMLLDLLSCRQELEEKSNELATKNSEIQELKANLSNKELLLEEAVAETKAQFMHAQQETHKLSAAHMKEMSKTHELHQEVNRLTAEHIEKQNEFVKKELSWQEKLGDAEKDYQLKLVRINEQHQVNISKLEEDFTARLVNEQKRGDDAEARVQQLDASSATSNAASMEELRRMYNFFKKNSEQLSKENREILAANRNLQESLRISRQQNPRVTERSVTERYSK